MQCKVYAFHCFSACANVFPPLGILYALPRRFSTASCPPPSPPTKEKDEERGWSRWKVVGGRVGGRGGYGWRGWVKVMLGWCEGGAMVEWRVECGECGQKLIPSKRVHLLYLFTSFAWSTAWDSLLPFSLLRSFFSSLPSPPFYSSISAQYPHTSSEKNVRGRKCGEEWAGMESGES